MNCKNITENQELREKHYPNMKESDKAYLGSLPDEQQYPAARCAMDPNVFLFDCKSTASVEAMNSANQRACNASLSC